MADPN